LRNDRNRSLARALILLFAWLGLMSLGAAAAAPPVASATQLSGDDTRTRFIADLSYPSVTASM